MSLWRSMRHEVSDAYRSLRDGLSRRSDRSRRHTEVLYPEYDAYEREHRHRPGRLAAAGGFGLVLAGGVAGTYFALAGGLGALLADASTTGPKPAASQPTGQRDDQGGGPAVPGQATPSAPDGSPPVDPAGTGPARTGAAPGHRVPAPATSTVRTPPGCGCGTLPSTPDPPSPAPSNSVSPSTSPSVSGPPSRSAPPSAG